MKIRLFSDLHLEFDNQPPFDPGEGDILLLAGDILTAKHLVGKGDKSYRFKRFIEECSTNYNKILYVAGNHEHFGFAVDKTHEAIKQALPDNFHLLENESIELGEWVFIGSTLWTNMNNRNPSDMFAVKQMMNDYHVVRYADKNYRKLLPEDTLAFHDESMEYLTQEVSKYVDKNIFLLTHHSPHALGISPRYVGQVSNCVYYSDLSHFILSNPNIKYWAFGHTHYVTRFKVGDCECISNPKGYNNEVKGFNQEFEIEI